MADLGHGPLIPQDVDVRVFGGSMGPSFEELRQRFVDALIRGRGAPWEAARAICAALRMAGTDKRARGQLVRSFAADGHCTAAYIRQLAQIGEAFPDESSLLDVSFALLRACIAAAKRTNGSAQDILEHALANGHHVAQVSKIGAEPREEYRLSVTCGGCATKHTLTATMAGPVRCGVCPEDRIGYLT